MHEFRIIFRWKWFVFRKYAIIGVSTIYRCEIYANEIYIILYYCLDDRNIKTLNLSVLKKVTEKEDFLDYSVQALLKVTVLQNPIVDSQTIVNNLLTIQQLKVRLFYFCFIIVDRVVFLSTWIFHIGLQELAIVHGINKGLFREFEWRGSREVHRILGSIHFYQATTNHTAASQTLLITRRLRTKWALIRVIDEISVDSIMFFSSFRTNERRDNRGFNVTHGVLSPPE